MPFTVVATQQHLHATSEAGHKSWRTLGKSSASGYSARGSCSTGRWYAEVVCCVYLFKTMNNGSLQVLTESHNSLCYQLKSTSARRSLCSWNYVCATCRRVSGCRRPWPWPKAAWRTARLANTCTSTRPTSPASIRPHCMNTCTRR